MTMRCLVADDHPGLVAAVTDFLESHAVEVVGVASQGEEAVQRAAETKPDVALVDFRMPKLSGTDLVERIREASPATEVIVYTAEAGDGLAADVIRAGAAGIVLKEAPLDDIVRALEAAATGRKYVDATLAARALMQPRRANSALTVREQDVLRLLAEGLRNDAIGHRLGISGETVRTHVQKACQRLGASTRTQAVATALRDGLIR
jgi:DNA-binding NarL/FixJ family response regulator